MGILSSWASTPVDGVRLFPSASDKCWRKHVPAVMRKDYVRLGETYRGKAWQPIAPELFAEFRANGNRTRFEEASFGRRKQFACLVMAEIMQHRGRFVPDICRGIRYFVHDEVWWGLPAHYPKSQPEAARQVVDLFNAETASMLAWTAYMLADEIDRHDAGLCDTLRQEIERRFLNPTLYERQGWKRNANNWNTWITSNWLECVMLLETDARKREQAVKGIKECMRRFLDGYPDDGGCEEGVDYWDRAGASFFESLYFLEAMGQPLSLTEAQQTKVHAMGSFITTMHIDDLTFVNFSDAKARSLPNINILFPFGHFLGDKPMMEFAAYIGARHQFLTQPSWLFQHTGNFPTIGRELLLLSMLDSYKLTAPVQPQTEDRYLGNLQIMVASTTRAAHPWFVAVKGGTNGESHNHNDVGNFIVYHDRQPVVIDLGRDTYTSQTFSKNRYTLTNNRSAYHNVPVITGREQSSGHRFKALDVAHMANDTLSQMRMNLASAYPEDTHVPYWNRTVSLNRHTGRVEVEEQFMADSLPEGQPTSIVLMCYGEPRVVKDGTITLQNHRVRLDYDSAVLHPYIEKVDMQDGIMKRQWQDNVYRILLRVQTRLGENTVRYRFCEGDGETH